MKPKFSVTNLNWKQLTAVAAGLLVILLLAVVIGLNLYFNETRLKKMVVPKLETYLGQKVKVDGIGLKFLPSVGVQIDDFRIVNQPEFEQQYLAQFAQFRLDLALLPLLKKEVKISEVSLSQPVFNLEQKKEKNNYQFLAGLAGEEETSNQESSSEGSKQEAKLKLDLASLSISEGQVNYINHHQQQKLELKGIEFDSAVKLAGGQLTTEGEFSIAGIKSSALAAKNLGLKELDFLLNHQLTVDLTNSTANFKRFDLKLADFNLQSQFDLFWSDDQVELANFTGESGSSQINLQALVSQFEKPKFNFSAAGELKLAELMADLPLESEVQAAGTVKFDLQGKQVNLAEVTADNQLSGQIEVSQLSAQTPALPAEVDELTVNLKVDKEQLTTDKLQIASRDSVVTGALVVDNWQKLLLAAAETKPALPGKIKLTLNSNRLNLDQLLPAEKSTESKAAKTEEQKSAAPAEEKLYLPNLNLEVTTKLNQVNYQGQQYSLVSQVKSWNGKAIVDNLIVRGLDSEVAVSGQIDYSQVQQTQDIGDTAVELTAKADLNLARLQAEAVKLVSVSELEDWTTNGRIKTEVTTQFLVADLLAGEEVDINQLVDKVGLKGQLAVENGKVQGNKLLTEGADLNLTLNFDNRNLKVNSLAVAGLESNLKGQISVTDWPNLVAAVTEAETQATSQIKVNLKSDQITGDKLLAAAKSSEEKPEKKTAEKDKPINLELLDQIVVIGDLEIAKVSYTKLAAQNLGLSLQLKNRVADLKQLQFDYAGGRFNGQTKVDLKDKLTYNGSFKAEEIETNQILSQLTKFKDRLFGSMNWQGDFSGQGLKLDTVELASKAKIKNGELKKGIIVEKWNQSLTFFDNQNLKFKNLAGNVQISGGQFKLKDFAALTKHGQVKLGGYSTLTGGLNYQLDYLLTEKTAQQLKYRRFYPTTDGQVRLDFKLTGSVTEPQFSWQKPDIESKLQAEKEKAKQKAEKEAEKKKEEAKQKIEEKKEKIKKDLQDKVNNLF